MNSTKTKVCMVIGDPINHSLSPQMHNAGYNALGISENFVYVAKQVPLDKLSSFVIEVRATGIRGVSCTIPHKQAIIPYLDEVDEIAKKIGAVNTVVNTDGILKGYNTDYLGVLIPLEKITTLENKKVVILGAGGASRAVCFAVKQKGAKLFIHNRTVEKAEALAKEFGGEVISSMQMEAVKQADIIINTTSVGLHPNENETPLAKEFITDKQIVFDLVYSNVETQLQKEAKEKGATVISGKEMLLYQGIAQFKLFTGLEGPVEAMRKAIE